MTGALVTHEAGRRRRACDGDHHDGGGDPVVEPALHRDQLTDAGGDDGVGDHRDPEGGVGGREGGAHEECQPQPQARPEPRGQSPPEQHGQGQPDGEEADVAPDVTAQVAQRQTGGVREEHPDQGDLDEWGERSRLLRPLDQPGPCERGADDDEHDRRRQVGAGQSLGDEPPAEQGGRDDDEGADVHGRSSCSGCRCTT